MKKLLLLSALALGSMTANAQWVENFDSSTSLPNGWAVINDGDSNGFVIGVPANGVAQTPSNVAKIKFDSQEAHDDYLITKAITVSAGVSDRISFWVRSRSTTFLEDYSVLLSTTDQTKEAFTVELQATENAPVEWTKKTFDLDAYNGQTVYVAVHATDTNQWELYVDSFVVSGIPSCEAPTGLSSSEVAATTADVSWAASASTVNGGYQVYYSTTNTAPDDTTTLDNTNSVSVDATATTATLNNLVPETTYYAWVRANCDDTDSSAWSSSVSFTTTATCVVPTNISSSNVVATAADISWDASVSTVNVGYQVYYSTTNTAPDDTTTLDDTNSVSVGATATTATLDNLVPETTYYAWVRANCDDTDSSDWTSSVSFTTPPTCVVPTNVSSSNATTNSVDISWTASTSTVNGGYQVYYSTSDTAPNDTTVLDDTNSVSTDASATSVAITGLTVGTTYYAWVRANCDDTDSSAWSSVVTFNTLCLSTDVPYVMNFDDLTTTSVGACETVINNGQGNQWTVENAPTGYTGKVLRYKWHGSNAANTWFFTQGLNLEANKNYIVKFKYGNNHISYTEKLKVAYGTDKTAAGMVHEIADFSNINDNTPHSVEYTITPTETGVYYIGFQAYSDINQYNLYLDDIMVELDPGAGTINQELTSLNVYPNPAKDVINISNDAMITGVEIFDINGRRLFNKAVGQTSTTIDVSSFATGTYFVKVTAEGKTSTKQIIVK